MRKGDIFDWQFKDEKLHTASYAYWCCTRRGVATDTLFLDTYWSDGGSRGRFTHERAEQELTLTFVANYADLEKINPWEIGFYRPEDVVDMRHSNNSGEHVYKRKGTSKSREVMTNIAKQRVEDWKYAVDSAQDSLGTALAELEAITHDGDLEKIYLRKRS